MEANCQVCGSSEWQDLPNPTNGKSVTTAGRIINESLGKAQCAKCGFAQRIHARFLGYTDYYEHDYQNYYNRPGTTRFHASRYRVLAEWMASILRPPKPSRILDVGCGQGWAMEAMNAIYPEATIEGLEPSHFNSQVARSKGFAVYEGILGEAPLPRNNYDLVYCNNVIQHVTNAREFLICLKSTVGERGRIIITCPDGSLPNIEILWGDQNFSFLPGHLLRLCEGLGFTSISWFPSPPSPSVPPAQMLFVAEDEKVQPDRQGSRIPAANLPEIYQARCDYLNSFRSIDKYLCARTENCARVFNLGASYWSSVLAAYCPRYWQRVTACLVEETDSFAQQFLDKPVLPFGKLTPARGDAIVFGTSPATHKALSERFAGSWETIVPWDGYAQY
jgi:SAM-dependent methyltransferase